MNIVNWLHKDEPQIGLYNHNAGIFFLGGTKNATKLKERKFWNWLTNDEFEWRIMILTSTIRIPCTRRVPFICNKRNYYKNKDKFEPIKFENERKTYITTGYKPHQAQFLKFNSDFPYSFSLFFLLQFLLCKFSFILKRLECTNHDDHFFIRIRQHLFVHIRIRSRYRWLFSNQFCETCQKCASLCSAWFQSIHNKATLIAEQSSLTEYEWPIMYYQ